MDRILTDLTTKEFLDLLEMIERCHKISTDEGLRELLLSIQNLMPCANIIAGLGEVDTSGKFKGAVKIINVSYPANWLAIYQERCYAEADPILKSHFGRFITQTWSETFRRAASQSEKEFIGHARSFGLSDGITVGIHSKRHSAGSLFSFADPSIAGLSRHARMLELLTPHLHLALMRTIFCPSGQLFTLSTRELEVLKWMKEGKTNWVISMILGISERTVKFHAQNILAKLQASTRGHAVALAMEHGLLGI